MKLVFQHLDTQSPNKFITLFGRTLDDKSVAVHVKDFSPKLYIVIDRDVRRLQALIRASLIRYKESKHNGDSEIIDRDYSVYKELINY